MLVKLKQLLRMLKSPLIKNSKSKARLRVSTVFLRHYKQLNVVDSRQAALFSNTEFNSSNLQSIFYTKGNLSPVRCSVPSSPLAEF